MIPKLFWGKPESLILYKNLNDYIDVYTYESKDLKYNIIIHTNRVINDNIYGIELYKKYRNNVQKK